MFSFNQSISVTPSSRQEWIDGLWEEFSITAEDLEANRHGQLSDRQRAYLEPKVTSFAGNPNCFTVLLGAMLVGLLLVIGLNIASGGLIAAFLATPLYGMGTLFVVAAGVVMLIPGALNTNRIRRSMDSMDKLVVHTLEGHVQKSHSFRGPNMYSMLGRNYRRRSRRGGGTDSRTISFGGESLRFHRLAAEKFLEGAVYRIYYLPLPDMTYLLSADLIDMP